MKKYIFMTLTVALLGLAACTEDAFDRINKDYEHPSPEAVPAATPTDRCHYVHRLQYRIG